MSRTHGRSFQVTQTGRLGRVRKMIQCLQQLSDTYGVELVAEVNGVQVVLCIMRLRSAYRQGPRQVLSGSKISESSTNLLFILHGLPNCCCFQCRVLRTRASGRRRLLALSTRPALPVTV